MVAVDLGTREWQVTGQWGQGEYRTQDNPEFANLGFWKCGGVLIRNMEIEKKGRFGAKDNGISC